MLSGRARGFTLIEVVVVLAVLVILAGALLPFVFRQLQETRRTATLQSLDALKAAIVGDRNRVSDGVRTDFGYLGDMGKLPGEGNAALTDGDKLKELAVRGNQAPFGLFASLKIGAGWQGPYLQKGASEGTLEARVVFDDFVVPFRYTLRSPTGLGPDDHVSQIISAGPDKEHNTADDITLSILKRESFARVFGFVMRSKSGRPVQNVPVTIFFPDGRKAPDPDLGILAKLETAIGKDGFYQFLDIPFGVRSVVVEPRLVLAEESARTLGKGSKVRFTVTNFSAKDVDIVSATVFYTVDPPAFYRKLKIGKTIVFKAAPDPCERKGSGETIIISPPIIVKGSGETFTPIAVHVESPETRVKDILLAEQGRKAGGSVTIEIKGFKDSRFVYKPKRDACDDEKNAGGKPVDMTGVEFTVVFGHSDGRQSVVTFIPVTRIKVENDDEEAHELDDDDKAK